MNTETIQERIAVYRKSKEEWLRRAAACDGAIEALEGLLPAVPLEQVLHAAGVEVDKCGT